MANFVNRVANDVGTSASLLYSDASNKSILIGMNISNKTGSTVPAHVYITKGELITILLLVNESLQVNLLN